MAVNLCVLHPDGEFPLKKSDMLKSNILNLKIYGKDSTFKEALIQTITCENNIKLNFRLNLY